MNTHNDVYFHGLGNSSEFMGVGVLTPTIYVFMSRVLLMNTSNMFSWVRHL